MVTQCRISASEQGGCVCLHTWVCERWNTVIDSFAALPTMHGGREDLHSRCIKSFCERTRQCVLTIPDGVSSSPDWKQCTRLCLLGN